jgi:two-component system phosphate regulon sensor histidine kinase PhoR
VYLSRPALLYEHQRTRRFWFGALIASSAAAVLIGLVANWRAFQRQERLSELKSNFVSSVSHELRTPIASVQLLVEGLESRRVSGRSKRQQYFRLIRQECRRLSALIENILDLSRIEQGRKEFELEPTDIIALVEQTVKIIEPYAAERKVALAVSLPASEIWPVKPRPSLDRGSIEQALLNLVDNAIKHSPEGQTVTIGLELADSGQEKTQGQKVAHPHTSAAKLRSPGPMFLIWVEDRGAGIPPEEHERIFEQFYRRGSELRRETQGVGIGLGIMKHIVESHGGRVLVRSAAGQGSRFTMVLPMNSQPADVAHEGS